MSIRRRPGSTTASRAACVGPLCGIDPYNGKSYEHRREWVEKRLLELAEIFAVGLYTYAVMSNHVHVVLRIDPTAAATWTDEEVAARWVRLFPIMRDGEIDEEGCRLKEETVPFVALDS